MNYAHLKLLVWASGRVAGYTLVFVFLPVPVLIILRIRNEEEVLVRELTGYAEYRQKTRYRLVPGVW